MQRSLVVAVVLSCLCGLAAVPHSRAQTVRYDATVGATAASSDRQPLWLYAQQGGRFDAASANGYAGLSTVVSDSLGTAWHYEAAGEVWARASNDPTVFVPELYGQVRYRFVRLRLGWKEEVLGAAHHSDLTTGSLIVSRNATPIPMIALGSAGYVDVPWTDGFLQVKARWAEGAYQTERTATGVRFHQKYVYARAGTDRLRLAAGLVHNAQWGGRSPRYGDIPERWSDYWRTIYATRGDEEVPVPGERTNIYGNHLGAYDFALSWQPGNWALTVSHQHPFEDGSGFFNWQNVPDGLYAVEAAGGALPRWLSRVRYEFVYTKNQSGSVHPPGRDDYYYHYVYEDGWTNGGHVTGNPLVLLRTQSSNTGARNLIASNRLVAHHVGVQGRPLPSTQYRLLATWQRHYGRYRDPLPAPRAGWSMLVEVRSRPFDALPLDVVGAVAADLGDVYGDTVGFRVGLSYDGLLHRPASNGPGDGRR